MVEELAGITTCPFWTREHAAAVAGAESFGAIADVALSILRTMPQPVVQVCGPMSTGGAGSRERNLRIFFECVEELRRRELIVFDQVPLQLGFDRLVDEWRKSNDGYCMPILRDVYRPIFRSGFVRQAFFLPGWQTSRGARWERHEVVLCGLDVCEFPDDWYASAMERVGRID